MILLLKDWLRMKSEKKTEIKVGITAFVAILLFVLIYGWAKNFSFNSEQLKLNVEFSTVAAESTWPTS